MNTLQLLVVYAAEFRSQGCQLVKRGRGYLHLEITKFSSIQSASIQRGCRFPEFFAQARRLSTRGLQILRVFCSSETPLSRVASLECSSGNIDKEALDSMLREIQARTDRSRLLPVIPPRPLSFRPFPCSRQFAMNPSLVWEQLIRRTHTSTIIFPVGFHPSELRQESWRPFLFHRC